MDIQPKGIREKVAYRKGFGTVRVSSVVGKSSLKKDAMISEEETGHTANKQNTTYIPADQKQLLRTIIVDRSALMEDKIGGANLKKIVDDFVKSSRDGHGMTVQIKDDSLYNESLFHGTFTTSTNNLPPSHAVVDKTSFLGQSELSSWVYKRQKGKQRETTQTRDYQWPTNVLSGRGGYGGPSAGGMNNFNTREPMNTRPLFDRPPELYQEYGGLSSKRLIQGDIARGRTDQRITNPLYTNPLYTNSNERGMDGEEEDVMTGHDQYYN